DRFGEGVLVLLDQGPLLGVAGVEPGTELSGGPEDGQAREAGNGEGGVRNVELVGEVGLLILREGIDQGDDPGCGDEGEELGVDLDEAGPAVVELARALEELRRIADPDM